MRAFDFGNSAAGEVGQAALGHRFDALAEILRLPQPRLFGKLVRGRLAHALVRLLTRLVTQSAMARHDGPLSILRSYTPREVTVLCEKAGLFDVRIAHHVTLIRQCAVRTKR